MRRIWMVGAAIAALVAVPAINMQAQAATFDMRRTATTGTTTDAGSDWLDLACSCGGGDGGSSGPSGPSGADGGREGTSSGTEDDLPN